MSENGTNSGILDKIKKLLRQAEDKACTPHEAEAFTAKAAQLIAKYGIDEAMLNVNQPSSDSVGDLRIIIESPYTLSKIELLAAIATRLRCEIVQSRRWVDGKKQLIAHLFGYGADLKRVELLYRSLLVQSTNALTAEYVPYGVHAKTYRVSWYTGYATAINRRLYQAEMAAQMSAETEYKDAGKSVALVLVDRGKLVKRAVDNAFPHLRKAQPRKISDVGATDGYRAGQRANLGDNQASIKA